MYETFERILAEKGLTPYKVSKATGISSATLTQWKQGKYTPKADKLRKIANYLGVPADYLLTGKENAIPGLSEEQSNLLSLYNDASPLIKRAAVAVLESEKKAAPPDEA